MSQDDRSNRFCDAAIEILDANYDEKRNQINSMHYQIIKEDDGSIRDLQKQDFKANAKYAYAWRGAEAIFEKKKNALATGKFADVPKEYHIALICYSGEIFKAFNEQTREFVKTFAQSTNFHFMSLFYFLNKACVNMSMGPRPEDLPEPVFHGRRGKFPATVGSKILFRQFLSTSTKRVKAMEFTQSHGQTKDKDSGHTLIEIQKLRPREMCTDLSRHSHYPDEAEVLIWPFEVFKVTEVKNLPNNGLHIVLIADFVV